ncbi:cell wall hydrolase [Burkholderiaceae bacterium UC74_6]
MKASPGNATWAGYRQFSQLSGLLALRWRGTPLQGARDIDWLRPELVQSLQLLAGGILEVNLRDGCSARQLPREWQGLRLRPVRAPALVAQAAPPRMTLNRTREDGTATALVRDRLNGQRCYLLTCGHVVAPDAAARFGDPVRVTLSAVSDTVGSLREWQPAVGPGNQPSSMDAALVELDEGALALVNSQASDWLPRAVSRDASPGRRVSLRRANDVVEGQLIGPWSGAVTGANAQLADYYLQGAIGYSAASPTLGGDSGAALWSEGDELLGMHIGAIQDSSNQANAVMTCVAPALDWFCVKPFTRDDPATVGPRDWPPLPERLARTAAAAAAAAAAQQVQPAGAVGLSRDQTILAKTLWGEARGEGVIGMQAVAAVVMNRLRVSYRGRTTAEAVCLDPKQFSCWNGDDVNLPLIERLGTTSDTDYQDALGIAEQALAGRLPDPTLNSKHYLATTLPAAAMPTWARGKAPAIVIGRQAFYNNIL